jgi:hypothetical protein
MTPQDIHEIATIEFGFRPELRADGFSYWTHAQGDRKSVRILRVSNSAGCVTEIKLAVSSLRNGVDAFLDQPITVDRLRVAIAQELNGAH